MKTINSEETTMTATEYGYAYAKWYFECGEFQKTGENPDEAIVEIGDRRSCTAPPIPDGDYLEMKKTESTHSAATTIGTGGMTMFASTTRRNHFRRSCFLPPLSAVLTDVGSQPRLRRFIPPQEER